MDQHLVGHWTIGDIVDLIVQKKRYGVGDIFTTTVPIKPYNTNVFKIIIIGKNKIHWELISSKEKNGKIHYFGKSHGDRCICFCDRAKFDKKVKDGEYVKLELYKGD